MLQRILLIASFLLSFTTIASASYIEDTLLPVNTFDTELQLSMNGLMKIRKEIREINATANELYPKAIKEVPLSMLTLRKLNIMFSRYEYLMNTAANISNQYNITKNVFRYDSKTVQQAMISISARLLLLESYTNGLHIYYEETKFFRLFNDADIAYRRGPKAFNKLMKLLVKNTDKSYFKEFDEFIKQGADQIALLAHRSPSHTTKRLMLLTNHVLHGTQIMRSFRDVAPDLMSRLGKRFIDTWLDTGEALFRLLASSIGNTTRKIIVRKGKLMNRYDVLANVIENLEPLDVLLIKAPAALNDKLITGYYSHAALWLGTEQQVKELGLWNHKKVKLKRYEIAFEHYYLIEALADGVGIHSIEHLLDADDLVVIRKENMTADEIKDRAKVALDHTGKMFDYNGHGESSTSLVCSELITNTFYDTEFELTIILGDYLIVPDNLLKKAIGENSEFYPIMLYHDGELIEDNLELHIQTFIREG